MSYTLPERIEKLTPYQPIEGNFNIRLDANESFIAMPKNIKKQIVNQISKIDFNRYPDARCLDLCKAFAEFYGVKNSDYVMAGNGSDELISLLLTFFVKPNTSIVATKPEFSMYCFYAQLAGAKLDIFEKKEDLEIDVNSFISFCKEKNPSIIILSNPCNPTSLELTKEDIIAIIKAMPNTLVVIDEAYMDFSKSSILEQVYTYNNLLVLKTCSKALGAANIRLGFAVANPYIINGLLSVKSPYNVNGITQKIGEILFNNKTYLSGCIKEIIASREFLFNEFKKIEKENPNIFISIKNTNANFIFIKVNYSQDIFDKGKEKGIAIRIMGDYLRISAGSREENIAAINLFSKL